MARTKYVIYTDMEKDPSKLLVAPLNDCQKISMQLGYNFIATYLFDEGYDLGAITVEDYILDVHSTGEEFKTECVKLCDGFLFQRSLDFSTSEGGIYPEFKSSKVEPNPDVENDVIDR